MASIGSYKGTQINAGTDAQIAAQIAAINNKSSGGGSSAGTDRINGVSVNPNVPNSNGTAYNAESASKALASAGLPSTITSSNLNQTAIKVPGAVDTSANALANIGSLANYTGMPDLTTDGADTTSKASVQGGDNLEKMFSDLRSDIASEDSVGQVQSIYDRSGVTAARQALLSAQNDLASTIKRAQDRQTLIKDQPIASPIIGRQARLALEQDNALATAQASFVQALQGNLDSAIDLAKSALTIETENKNKKFQLAVRQIDIASEKASDERRLQYDIIKQKYLSQIKQNEDFANLKLQAASQAYSAGNATVGKKILDAQTPDQFYAVAGKFGVSLDDQYKKAQIANTYSQINDRNTTSASTSAFKFTAEDKQLLVGAGFSGVDLNGIENDLNKYGLEQVVKNPSLTEKQKSALQQVLNKGNTAITTTNLTRANVASLFGIPDNGSKSGVLGSWFNVGKTNSEKLNEIMSSIAKYQAVGYSDADILKLMQSGK